MSEKKKGYEEKRSPDEDPDFYVRTLAATWGHLDLVRDWLQHHEHEPGKVTENVLFPAAMYGQLEVLGHAIPFGELPPSNCPWFLLGRSAFDRACTRSTAVSANVCYV